MESQFLLGYTPQENMVMSRVFTFDTQPVSVLVLLCEEVLPSHNASYLALIRYSARLMLAWEPVTTQELARE